MTVAIDMGHGGKDRGTTAGLTDEADLTYQAGHNLSRLLRVLGRKAKLLRKQGEDPSNEQRRDRAIEAGADWVLSIHVNEGPSAYHGGHAFYSVGDGIGKQVCDAVMEGWPEPLKRHHLHATERNGIYIAGRLSPSRGNCGPEWRRSIGIIWDCRLCSWRCFTPATSGTTRQLMMIGSGI